MVLGEEDGVLDGIGLFEGIPEGFEDGPDDGAGLSSGSGEQSSLGKVNPLPVSIMLTVEDSSLA